MAQKIIMPKQGLQMTEGTIIKWLKKEGDLVEKGEPLFEMETDKLTITIDASASGTLLKIVRQEGEVVEITETIAIVGTPGEDISACLGAPVKEEIAASEEEQVEVIVEKKSNQREFATPRAKMRASERQISIEKVSGTGPEGLVIEKDVLAFKENQVKATPVAKKLAELHDVDLASVVGSGVKGKIMKSDVLEKCTSSNPNSHEETIVEFNGMRKAISTNMMQSLHSMAQANHRMKVDMSESVRFREKMKVAGIKVSYTDILIKAVSAALIKYPQMNACVDGNKIICKHYVNMGVAVAIENGLIVPNIKDAHSMSVTEIHDWVAVLADKARKGTLVRSEYTEGTFTITNLGMYEIDEFTPIINPPEVGILGVGAIVDTPVAVDGKVEIRPMMTLSLTYDHRVIDGAPAAEFLRHVKTLLQNPYLML